MNLSRPDHLHSCRGKPTILPNLPGGKGKIGSKQKCNGNIDEQERRGKAFELDKGLFRMIDGNGPDFLKIAGEIVDKQNPESNR